MGLPDPGARFPNLLIDELAPKDDSAASHAMLQKCIEAQRILSQVSIATLVERLGGESMWAGIDLRGVHDFLAQRICRVVTLLSSRLGLPDMGFTQ